MKPGFIQSLGRWAIAVVALYGATRGIHVAVVCGMLCSSTYVVESNPVLVYVIILFFFFGPLAAAASAILFAARGRIWVIWTDAILLVIAALLVVMKSFPPSISLVASYLIPIVGLAVGLVLLGKAKVHRSWIVAILILVSGLGMAYSYGLGNVESLVNSALPVFTSGLLAIIWLVAERRPFGQKA